jgi:outer membrane immunogenic protein
MKKLLLAGAALAAMMSASSAADYAAPDVDVWSGYFVGIAGGYAFKDADVIGDDGSPEEADFSSDDFIIGAYYGRNWQSGSWVFGLDSSFNYIGLDEGDVFNAPGEDLDITANFLGLSRLKVGYAVDNTLFYAAGGLATTIFEAEDDNNPGDDDDDWAFGFTVGAGVEHKFSDNWSARIEYAYFNIESDEMNLPSDIGDVDIELEGHIVRAGVAYHF